MNSTCYIDSPAKVTPEGIAREIRIIKGIRSDGQEDMARTREETLYDLVADAIALGLITGEASGLREQEEAEVEVEVEVERAVPRFRLLA